MTQDSETLPLGNGLARADPAAKAEVGELEVLADVALVVDPALGIESIGLWKHFWVS